MPPLTLGLSYRSRYKMNFDNAALQANNVPLELSTVVHDTRAVLNVPIPDLVSLGIGVRPIESLFLQAQFDWTGWEILSELRLVGRDPALSLTLPQRWRNGYALRVGGEYTMQIVSLRAGFGVDWSPVPRSTLSPIIPDAQRYYVSGGVGVRLPKGFAVEGAIFGAIFRGRTSELPELPVHYNTWALLVSFAVSYHHPKHHENQPAQ
jgi:long-chain fatty acid transport protein